MQYCCLIFGEKGDEYIYLRMHDISCWLGEDQEQKRKPFSAAKKIGDGKEGR